MIEIDPVRATHRVSEMDASEEAAARLNPSNAPRGARAPDHQIPAPIRPSREGPTGGTFEAQPVWSGQAFVTVLLAALVVLWSTQHFDWSRGMIWWTEVARWCLACWSPVGPGASLLWVLAPAVFMFALCGSLLLAYEKPPRWVRLPLGMVFLSVQASYLSYRLLATLCLDTWLNAVLSVAFFLSELFIHLRIAFGNLSLLYPTDRTARADASARLVRSGWFQPSVDVLVPTYSEPVEMLRRTLIGCQAMDYSRKTVYLLDDQRRPAMRALAKELGCRYLTRSHNAHAKAGNLNHALARTDGELIACFDADFVPTTDFLQRTIGFFVDPKVALVQTPQNFFNDDAPSRNLGLERVLQDEQRFFFRALQPGRDAMNAIVCHGSCYVGRRAALETIGGIPTETITEDWATSLKLQAAGYTLYYLNEALSAGVSADRSGEFLQQRSRWAQGTLQALFASTNPVTMRGLSWRQRLLHVSGILYYLGSFSHLFNLVAPLAFLFFGAHILRVTVPEILFFRLPFMVGYYMLFSWITDRTRSAIWTEFYDAFLAPTLASTALRSLIKPFGRGFRVTDKTASDWGLSLNLPAAWPFALLLGLHGVGLVWAIVTGRHLQDPDLFAIVAWFAAANMLLLWLCLLVTFDVPQSSLGPRFDHVLPAELQHEGQTLRGRTLSFSENEIVFIAERPLTHFVGPTRPASVDARGERGTRSFSDETGRLRLPSLTISDLAVRVRPTGCPERLRLAIVAPTLSQRRRIITFLYCRPGQWDRSRRPRGELRAVGEYFRAVLRMYPLAESK